jgi:hypothetical protein
MEGQSEKEESLDGCGRKEEGVEERERAGKGRQRARQ